MLREFLVDRYQVGHYAFSANYRSLRVPDAVILCYEAGSIKPGAAMSFYKINDDERTTPFVSDPRVEDNRIVMSFRLDRYAQILDLLRHESPIFIWAADGIGGLNTPMKEPVGEGDVDPIRPLSYLTGDALFVR